MRSLLLVTVLAIVLPAVLAGDACTFAQNQFYTRANVLNCFTTIPYQPKIAQQTVDALLSTIELYSFLDIAVQPPKESDGLSVKPVDLLGELKSIRSRQYASDYSFQTDLTALYRSLQDAHTRYILPYNYQNFQFFTPLGIVSYVENNEQIVAISPAMPDATTMQWYSVHQNLDLNIFANATVLQINGKNTMEVLTNYARDNVGISKDLGTRFNLLMTIVTPAPAASQGGDAAIDGLWQRRRGDFVPHPTEETITYQLKLTNGTVITVTFPWLARVAKSYDNQADFQNDWKAFGDSTSSVMDLSKPFLLRTREPEPLEEHLRTRRIVQNENGLKTPYAANPQFKPIWQSASVSLYSIVGDSRTVVMYIPSFGPRDTNQFMMVIAQGLDAAAQMGLDHLLIDLTQNGGGDICLTHRLLDYLVKSEPFPCTDMPNSELASTMAKAAAARGVSGTPWSFDSWTSEGGANFTDASWLLNGTTHVRGGRTRQYSQLIHLNDASCSYDPPFPSGFRKNITQIMIVTHGFCGSSCALVASHASQYDQISTVVVGGIRGRPQQAWSFPGGQVLGSNDIIQLATQLVGSNSPLAPVTLPTTAMYRLAIREVYPHPDRTEVPSEYAFIAADHHLDETLDTVLHPENVWLKVRDLFESK